MLQKPAKDNRGKITDESLKTTKKRARTTSAGSNDNAETCIQVIIFSVFVIDKIMFYNFLI